MTLQASGVISAENINEELGRTAGATFSMDGDHERWLAEQSSGSFSFSDFYSQTACKVVDTATASGAGTSITFSNVNFGPEYSGRILIACVGLWSSLNKVLNQSTCTIGGTATSGDDSGENLGSGPSVSGGVWAAEKSLTTSGDVIINWTGGSASTGGLILLSAPGTMFAHAATGGWNGGGSGGTGGTQTLNIPANGLLIAAMMHANTNNTTLTGVTERAEITIASSARLCVGFDNRKSVQTGDSVGASWSGSTAWGGEARSYAQ